MKILIVDDIEENRYLLEALLKGNGHEVAAAANGVEALETLKSGGIDLIVSDILMPVMDGFKLCRKVKTDQSLRHIPLIIYTATYSDPKDEAFALKIGADRFIIKPCEPIVFMAAVREVMAAAGSRISDSTPEPAQEEEVLRIYNERLVRKLEQKMLQLEKEFLHRKDAEESLRISNTRLRLALASANIGLWNWDLATNEVWFSPEWKLQIGYEDHEVSNRYEEWENRLHPEDRPRILAEVEDYLNGRRPDYQVEFRFRQKDGSYRWIAASGKLMSDADGKSRRFMGCHVDISERKQAEDDRKKLEAQFTQAQKLESVGRLAGGVAHDFNNLLSVILGYSEIVLQDLSKNHPHHESLKEVHQAAVRAKDLTRQLLAFSRKQVFEMQVVDINQVLSDFKKMLRRLIGEDITLEMMLATRPLPVRADISQIEQVIMNLAVNARDAMPDGGALTIETAAVELDEAFCIGRPGVKPGAYAYISVSDSGCGMGKEIQDRLFEPFFTTKSKDKGTGLGLATTYGIVKQHGGNIWVYSEPGEGTVFKIYLPLCSETTVAGAVVTARPEHASLVSTATVLVVEDDRALRKLAVSILRQGGYDVLESDSAIQAVECAKTHPGPIHLVLTDVIMPGMKGPEVYEKIREHHPEAKALYMSGYTDDMIVRHGVLQEGIAFIQKPFTFNSLLEKTAKALAG